MSYESLYRENSKVLYLLVYKSTFYDLNFSPKNGPRLIHKSYTKKKIVFEALKMGIDLYTSSTYTRVNTVMLAREPSLNIINSEILGFLDFLPFSLPELTTSPTICCCIVVRSEWRTASEIELGPCSPKLTAATT